MTSATRGSVQRSVRNPCAAGPARSAPSTAAKAAMLSWGLRPALARALQSGAAPGFPRVVPVVRTDARDAELLGHRRLRFPSREQPRGVQPARFQRDKISSGCGHASHAIVPAKSVSLFGEIH